VVEYLQTGWTADQLRGLFAEAGLTPRDALREKEAAATVPALLDAAAADDAILQAMLADPVLVNRPIVRTPRGAAMCRPSEKVFDLLDRRPDRFVKEDGEVVELDQPAGAPPVGPA
jgi:arsenate reductase